MGKYSTVVNFIEKNKTNIEKQWNLIEALQKVDSPNYPTSLQIPSLRTDWPAFKRFYRHAKSMVSILKWVDLIKGRRVIDVGSGFGSAYYPLRFANAKEIIAIDPFEENIELIADLGYDGCFLAGWEDFEFLPGDLIWVRLSAMPDYHAFGKRMHDCGVSDMLISDAFPDLPGDENLYKKITLDQPSKSRWIYNQQLDHYYIPTLETIYKQYRDIGYDLSSKERWAITQDTIQYTLHFIRR